MEILGVGRYAWNTLKLDATANGKMFWQVQEENITGYICCPGLSILYIANYFEGLLRLADNRRYVQPADSFGIQFS